MRFRSSPRLTERTIRRRICRATSPVKGLRVRSGPRVEKTMNREQRGELHRVHRPRDGPSGNGEERRDAGLDEEVPVAAHRRRHPVAKQNGGSLVEEGEADQRGREERNGEAASETARPEPAGWLRHAIRGGLADASGACREPLGKAAEPGVAGEGDHPTQSLPLMLRVSRPPRYPSARRKGYIGQRRSSPEAASSCAESQRTAARRSRWRRAASPREG